MPIEHWMVFGTFAEQRHFEYPAPATYDGVIINANMAAHAPEGLAAFLLERTAGMKYIVDPLTHAFQHDVFAVLDKAGKPKSSIQSLAEAYGEPVASTVGRYPLQPEDLQDETAFERLVQGCMDFQSRQLTERMLASKVTKYLDSTDEFRPYALVAPYFYVTEATLDDWLPLNVKAARAAKAFADAARAKMFVSVVVSQGVITSPEARRRVIREYEPLDIDGCLLWVDALDELSASGPELRGLLALARGLRGSNGRDVLNVHGGYFSILAAGALGNGAMTGVAHGPEFGEYREVVPVGGGIHIARYYVPLLHARVRYRDALRIFRSAGWLTSAETFYSEVCACDECKSVIEDDPANFRRFFEGTVKNVRRRYGIVRIDFPTVEAKLRCLRHYLQSKRREYEAAANADKPVLLRNLAQGEEKFRKVAGLDAVAHLRLWKDVFSNSGDA